MGHLVLLSIWFINNPGVGCHQHQRKYPQSLLTPRLLGLRVTFQILPHPKWGIMGHLVLLREVEASFCILLISAALLPQDEEKMSFLKNLGNRL